MATWTGLPFIRPVSGALCAPPALGEVSALQHRVLMRPGLRVSGEPVRHPFLLRRARHHRALSFSVPGRPGPSVGRAVPAPSFPRHAHACRRWRTRAYPHGQTTECVRSSEGWCSLCSPRSRHGSQLASAFLLPSAASADCTRRSLRAGGLSGESRSGFFAYGFSLSVVFSRKASMMASISSCSMPNGCSRWMV